MSQSSLLSSYLNDSEMFEIGVDEAGRGPLFGRVYAAAVILPKPDQIQIQIEIKKEAQAQENEESREKKKKKKEKNVVLNMEAFDYSKMKDSKKFSSKKKIEEVAEYIQSNSLAWCVSYEDETVIDEINILQATQSAMHKAIQGAITMYYEKNNINPDQTPCQNKFQLLIDGNYFKPIISYNKERKMCESMPYVCIEGGDNKYASIAAASILAKVHRDAYIDDLCDAYPDLREKYAIHSNKGYGAKIHMDGIKQYGITQWHRKSYAPCARALALTNDAGL